jgi:hypothetical protein
MSLIVYFWCSSCTSHPWTSQDPMQMMHMFRGRMCYNLTPSRLTCLLSTLDIVSKVHWKEKVNLDKEKASTAFRYKCILSQVCTWVLIAFCSCLTFWWGNGVKRAKSYLVLVLNAKGGEIKAKANGSANHLLNFKNYRVRIFVFDQNSLIANLFSYGGEFSLWENGEFVAFNQIYSWKISWFAKTSVLDLEIGKINCFVKINQVVAKVIQICQNLNWS